jgi:hypothetical protein
MMDNILEIRLLPIARQIRDGDQTTDQLVKSVWGPLAAFF